MSPEASDCSASAVEGRHPLNSFILKVASRCNLNCSYCFMYNLVDRSWKSQPKIMSPDTFSETCTRIREHCLCHGQRSVSIALHGGEPMLVGIEVLREYRSIVRDELESAGIGVDFVMQSNGTIFSEELGEFLLESGIGIGISLDGPPDVQDTYRIDHRGRGSSPAVERTLRAITQPRYRPIFRGFLCVINAGADARSVVDYLLSFDPPMIDLILPDDNYDRLPYGKARSLDDTSMGHWLVQAFDTWYRSETPVRVRYFENILKLILGGTSDIETIGNSPADFIIVETDGTFELLDSLKGSYEGATYTGMSVFRNGLDEVADLCQVRSRQLGVEALSATCRACEIVDICGGGYLPHRYSTANSFDNPSVYCSDLKMIIHHAYRAISEEQW